MPALLTPTTNIGPAPIPTTARKAERPSELSTDNAASGTRPNNGRRACNQPTTSAPANIPTGALSPMSTPAKRSAGKPIEFKGKSYIVEAIRPEAFAGVDIVLSSTPASVSRESSPMAAKAGAIVIDNSSAWRMDPEVPLVVPEVNADALRVIPKGIVANPNCSTIQMVVALKPLHDLAKIKRVVVATYQASSGKGAKGLFELDAQVAALGRGQPLPAVQAHAAQLAGNVLPHDWKAGDVAIVHNNCVHQHFNASAREPARALVIKTKPMYLFMNMLFQHTVIKRPKTPSPTQGNFVPRDDEEDFNHPAGKVEEEV